MIIRTICPYCEEIVEIKEIDYRELRTTGRVVITCDNCNRLITIADEDEGE